MADTSTPYRHLPLLPGADSVRLLRIVPPAENDSAATIHCELANYKLGETGEKAPQYEALSYVWGDCRQKRQIFLHGQPFDVTINLYAALLRLRKRCTGWIWIDGICINQKDDQERGHQVRYMAKIYSKAHRVVVWLGEEADDSARVFEAIYWPVSLEDETFKRSVLALLRRSWFRRIWILQEVAVARRIEIICGAASFDGYRFCVRLKCLQPIYKMIPNLYNLICSVTYLIRRAGVRLSHGIRWQEPSILSFRPMGELLDMYHTHDASERHDKIYALLGMRSDATSNEIVPDYKRSWRSLFFQVIEPHFPKKAFIHTWENRELSVIRASGKIIATVSSILPSSGWTDEQELDIVSIDTTNYYGYHSSWTARMTIQASAKSVQPGDLICMFEDSSTPKIIRNCKSYLKVIIIAACSPKIVRMATGESEDWSTVTQRTSQFPRYMPLIWDWGDQTDTLYSSSELWALLEEPHMHHVEEGTMPNHSTKLIKGIWLDNMAFLSYGLGDIETANSVYMKAFEAHVEVLSKECISAVQSEEKQLKHFSSREDWELAAQSASRLSHQLKNLFGNVHPDTLTVEKILADLCVKLGRWWHARELYEEIFEARTKLLGAEHPETIVAAEGVVRCYHNLAQNSHAETWLETRVEEPRRRILGPDHPLTKKIVNKSPDHDTPASLDSSFPQSSLLFPTLPAGIHDLNRGDNLRARV